MQRQGTNSLSGIIFGLNAVLADMFALYFKTKNFHWHVFGPHFRDYHLMFDQQAEEVFAVTDAIAERVRKLGGSTLRSIGHVARLQGIADSEEVTPREMLSELHADNAAITVAMRQIHSLCDAAGDVATASLLEVWIDEADRRAWFLLETGRDGESLLAQPTSSIRGA